MIHIVKQNEPKELTELREAGALHYDELRGNAKKTVKKALLEEQGYLCAYCMRNIEYLEDAAIRNVTIEHYYPQSVYNGANEKADLRLSYQNFLGVCVGFYDLSPNIHHPDHLKAHCENVRGNKPLKINPQDKDTIAELKYTNNGQIFSEDEDINNDVDDKLNLNLEILRQNRLQAWDGVQKGLAIIGRTPSTIQQLFAKYSNRKDGKRFEYCGIVLYHLQKELNKLNK